MHNIQFWTYVPSSKICRSGVLSFLSWNMDCAELREPVNKHAFCAFRAVCEYQNIRRRPAALYVPIHWDVQFYLKHQYDCFQISSWTYYISRLWLRFPQITLLFIHSYIHYSSLGDTVTSHFHWICKPWALNLIEKELDRISGSGT
jgi:hypothetical protein